MKTQELWTLLVGLLVTTGLEHLKGLNIEVLCLEDTQVTDAGLKHLKRLPKLSWLELGNTKVTDAGLEHLRSLTGLERLHLDGTQVTDAGVNELKRALPNLEVER